MHWQAVITFWFGEPGSPERGRPRKQWFEKSAAFDATVRERFAALHAAARDGRLDAWRRTPLAALALVVALDQFPRNMYRDTPQAFASDPQALAIARHIVDQGFDAAYLPVERVFAYIPFEHAEDIAMQRRSLELVARLPEPARARYLEYARRHHDIVARFGRFPHRNGILDRASTPEEVEFLKQPGSSF